MGRSSSPNPRWLSQHIELIYEANIKTLRLSIPKLGCDAFRTILYSLQEENKHLEELWIDGDSIDIGIAAALVSVLRVNTKLRVLRLSNTCITGNGSIAIFDSLKENHSLKELHLENNEIGPYAINSLASMLRCNTKLGGNRTRNFHGLPEGTRGKAQSIGTGVKRNAIFNLRVMDG